MLQFCVWCWNITLPNVYLTFIHTRTKIVLTAYKHKRSECLLYVCMNFYYTLRNVWFHTKIYYTRRLTCSLLNHSFSHSFSHLYIQCTYFLIIFSKYNAISRRTEEFIDRRMSRDYYHMYICMYEYTIYISIYTSLYPEQFVAPRTKPRIIHIHIYMTSVTSWIDLAMSVSLYSRFVQKA